MRVMLAAPAAVMLKMSTGDIVGLIGHHPGMIVMPGHWTPMLVARRHPFAHGMRGLAFHGDGRERLNREAQHEQQHDKEFAPARHGNGV